MAACMRVATTGVVVGQKVVRIAHSGQRTLSVVVTMALAVLSRTTIRTMAATGNTNCTADHHVA